MVEEYKTLGLNISASKEDVKKAYRKLSLLYHPDMPSGDEKKFIKVKQAYEALMVFDPNKTHNIHYEERSKPKVSVCISKLLNGNIMAQVLHFRCIPIAL